MKTFSYFIVLFTIGYFLISQPKVEKVKFKPLKIYSHDFEQKQLELDNKIMMISKINRYNYNELYKKDTIQ